MPWHCVRDRLVTALVRHRCFLCGELIPAGAVYRLRTGIGDDGFAVTRMHQECEAETREWDTSDWETFSEGDMPRPSAPR